MRLVLHGYVIEAEVPLAEQPAGKWSFVCYWKTKDCPPDNAQVVFDGQRNSGVPAYLQLTVLN